MRKFLWLLALTVVVMFSVGEKIARAADGNDVIKQCTDSGTTYEQEKCKKANGGKQFTFEGIVKDVKDAKKLRVMLDSGNYADVVFKDRVAEKVGVGETITFVGKISKFGSGIMFKHAITNGALKK